MALPIAIEQSFKSQSASGQVRASCRALNSLEGDLGETYVLMDEAALYLYSRRIGSGTREIRLPASDISAASVVEDRPFAYLQISSGGEEYKLKFSAFDQEVLKHFAALTSQPGTPAAEPPPGRPQPPPVPKTEPPPVPVTELTPLAGFCAAVYALIQVDGNVDPQELELLNRQVGNPAVVAQGLEWLRRLGTVALIERLREMYDHAQKLCLLANMLEISMVDGLLRSTEKSLMQQFREALNVEKDDYDAIFEIILIKNNLAVYRPPAGKP